MNNRQKKKESANNHNTAKDISDHILHTGTCRCEDGDQKCNGMTFMYLNSADENIFNYYHDLCTEVGDIRNPKTGQDFFWFPLNDIMRTLANNYTPEKIEELQEKNLKV
jgi:hypothetical protein